MPAHRRAILLSFLQAGDGFLPQGNFDHFENWFPFDFILDCFNICGSCVLFSPFVFLSLGLNEENWRASGSLPICLQRLVMWRADARSREEWCFSSAHWLLCRYSVPPALRACVSMDSFRSCWPRWSCTHWAISRSVFGSHETLCRHCPALQASP